MLRLVKKSVIGLVDWFLYKALKTSQKQFLSSLLTEKQKQAIKRVIKPGKKQTQLRKIERLKYRLYNLGFTNRALEDLQLICRESGEPYLKRLAAWELALWHANQYTTEDAKACLRYLDIATTGVKDRDDLRAVAIVKAECYDLLGEREQGKELVQQMIETEPHPDLYLAAANLETTVAQRMKWINKVFAHYGTEPLELTEQADEKSPYDALGVNGIDESSENDEQPKVTVIIPAFNAESVIQTSIESMQKQTWTNLEIFVVDDCSTDETASIVHQYAEQDHRVHYLKTETNSGAYVARNIALQHATGDFVTINDADDWSHSRKIEIQVRHLLKHPNIIGNFSQQARATNDLKFYRRGKPGLYIFANMSSFMFRRKPAMDKLGYWDCVRFAGDSEFVKRIKLAFGEKAVVELPTAPLSFQRQSGESLTSHSAFGFPGYFMGARREYAEAHDHFHRTSQEGLRYSFPQKERPFPVPEPMLPNRQPKSAGQRHFDVILASEFRLLGGTNMSNVEEIKAQREMGLRTGLIQLSRYDLNSVEAINPNVRELIDGDQVQMIVYGEQVSCDVLIVRHPPILQEWQRYVPNVEAKSVHVIVNQPPQRDYGDNGSVLYELPRCIDHLQAYFGNRGIWYPIGPNVREALSKHHHEDLQAIPFSDQDWVNIINVKEWKRVTRREKDGKIKIGRHSRDQYVKWPKDRATMLQIYPDKEPFEVHILGGAKSPTKVLGSLPSNWHVREFGEVHPREFLAELDVFVYFTHPDWVEAFGRVVFEAMAAGVPVIVPHEYEKLFGEAAIYAEINEVQEKVMELMADDEYYQNQVEKALIYVENQFGYSQHAARLETFLHEDERAEV
ncbi:glycosyltransferase [Halalkalibacterium halodurans]|uniref:glycosyltransferase n=1 Tax=Halalkalibacterium halodurans TaxID=86665 RepID=UPI002E22EB80|nr:glycosyltransferase [Halalkalibacterium halodurans]